MNDYDDDTKQAMAELATAAKQTETAYRLASALMTSGLIGRIVGNVDQFREMSQVAEQNPEGIVEAANREYDELSDEDRQKLAAGAMDFMTRRLVVATEHAWWITQRLDLGPPEDIDPNLIAFLAVAYAIYVMPEPDDVALSD
jgi:hypothetical protein